MHNTLSHLLGRKIDEAVGRIASSHGINSNVDSLNTIEDILEQLLNILGRRLIRHISNVESATVLNGLLCLQIGSALGLHIFWESDLSIIDWLPEPIT